MDSANDSGSTNPFTASSEPTDLSRKYGTQNPKYKNYFTCNFCPKVVKGGSFRFKQHLVGGNRNVIGCPNCPKNVREEVNSFFLEKESAKEDCQMIPRMQQLNDCVVELSKRKGGTSSGKLLPQQKMKTKRPY